MRKIIPCNDKFGVIIKTRIKALINDDSKLDAIFSIFEIKVFIDQQQKISIVVEIKKSKNLNGNKLKKENRKDTAI